MKIYGNEEYSFDGKNITYLISVGLDVEKDKKHMPSLSFIENHGHLVGEKTLAFWDNENYLLDILYKKVLKPWVENKEILDTKGFAVLLQIPGVDLEDFQGLIELIELTIKKGFYEGETM